MRKISKVIFQLVLLGGGIFILIIAITGLSTQRAGIAKDIQPGYPVPPTPTTGGYPAPRIVATSPLVTISTPVPTPTRHFSDLVDPTKYALMVNRTQSPTEIAKFATVIAAKNRITNDTSEPKQLQSMAIPISSEADLPNIVYNDTFISSDPTFSSCINSRKPGPPSLVQMLDEGKPNYYILPFFAGNQLCAIATIEINENVATLLGVGGALGDTYPQVSAKEAMDLVVSKTGLTVKGQPILAYQSIREDVSPYHPFWKIDTTNGQTYFVLFLITKAEDGTLNKSVTIVNANDINPIQ